MCMKNIRETIMDIVKKNEDEINNGIEKVMNMNISTEPEQTIQGNTNPKTVPKTLAEAIIKLPMTSVVGMNRKKIL